MKIILVVAVIIFFLVWLARRSRNSNSFFKVLKYEEQAIVLGVKVPLFDPAQKIAIVEMTLDVSNTCEDCRISIPISNETTLDEVHNIINVGETIYWTRHFWRKSPCVLRETDIEGIPATLVPVPIY